MSKDENDARWCWWYVTQGEWHDRRSHLDFLCGSLDEMAEEAGGKIELVYEVDTPTLCTTVYHLKPRLIKIEDREAVAEQIELWNNWYGEGEEPDILKAYPDRLWYYFFMSVHPSAYLVFIHWGINGEWREVHGIFCATYKDMVEVVKLHKGL